ncbi:MAG: sugar phosphate nucleotidyltransferase [bacterium]
MKKIVSVVLAAGQSKRMKSRIQKILHTVIGKPLIQHVIEMLEDVPVSKNIIIVSPGAQDAQKALKGYKSVNFAVQKDRLGTGHAVGQAKTALKGFKGTILVVCGDTPLLRAQTIKDLITTHQEHKAAATILTTDMDDPKGYGRIIHNLDGSVEKIVEEKDASSVERAVKEINTGTYCFDSMYLFGALQKITNKNKQGEYYLTDVIEVLRREGHKVMSKKTPDPAEAKGINTRSQLAEAENVLRKRILSNLMDNGVSVVDPETTFVESSVLVGMDTKIHPCTVIRAGAKIGSGVIVEPFSVIGEKAVIKDGVRIGSGSVVMPHVVVKKDVPVLSVCTGKVKKR